MLAGIVVGIALVFLAAVAVMAFAPDAPYYALVWLSRTVARIKALGTKAFLIALTAGLTLTLGCPEGKGPKPTPVPTPTEVVVPTPVPTVAPSTAVCAWVYPGVPPVCEDAAKQSVPCPGGYESLPRCR